VIDKSEVDIVFPSGWIDGQKFDQHIAVSKWFYQEAAPKVIFKFDDGCKIMVDAAVRVLSFVNQLVSCGKCVSLEFAQGYEGTMGYLDRVGFFDLLDASVNTVPQRPSISSASITVGAQRSV